MSFFNRLKLARFGDLTVEIELGRVTLIIYLLNNNNNWK